MKVEKIPIVTSHSISFTIFIHCLLILKVLLRLSWKQSEDHFATNYWWYREQSYQHHGSDWYVYCIIHVIAFLSSTVRKEFTRNSLTMNFVSCFFRSVDFTFRRANIVSVKILSLINNNSVCSIVLKNC